LRWQRFREMPVCQRSLHLDRYLLIQAFKPRRAQACNDDCLPMTLVDFFLVVVSVTSLLFSLFFSRSVLVVVLTEDLSVSAACVLLAEFCRVLAFTPTQQKGTTQNNKSLYQKALKRVQTTGTLAMAVVTLTSPLILTLVLLGTPQYYVS